MRKMNLRLARRRKRRRLWRKTGSRRKSWRRRERKRMESIMSSTSRYGFALSVSACLIAPFCSFFFCSPIIDVSLIITHN